MIAAAPTVVALLCASLALAPCDVRAQGAAAATPREWKLSIAVGPAFALGKAGARWATLVGERSAGRMPVKVFPGAVLAQRDPAREFAALAEGRAELAVGSTLYWSVGVDELNVVGLPWLAPGAAQLAALAAEPVASLLAAALERSGVVALAFAPLGHRALATTGAAVTAPGDLKGLRIRVPAVPALVDIYAALGATPQALGFAEAQTAFKAGALDAQDGGAASIVAARLEAVGLRNVADWKAIGELAVFAVHHATWATWSDVERAWVRAAAQAAAAELERIAADESEQALALLRQRGFATTRLTAEGHAAFASATRTAYERWGAVAGEELVRAAEAAVRSAGR